MIKDDFKIPEMLTIVAAQMRASLHQNLVPHPGELGTGREEVLRNFLRRHLPKRFGVSTGFVFDAHGSISKQIDVIIYDALVCPQFEPIDGKMFYPCESVVCVGEVKSSLTSKKEISNAFANLRSVKALDRSADGWNVSGIKGGPIEQESDHLDQIFAFLFVSERCASEKTMRSILRKFHRENERHLWPNVCFYFDQYLLTYYCDGGVCPNPIDAFAISSITNRPAEELLLRFYTIVARAVEATRVSTFPYWYSLEGVNDWNAEIYEFEDVLPRILMLPHIQNQK